MHYTLLSTAPPIVLGLLIFYFLFSKHTTFFQEWVDKNFPVSLSFFILAVFLIILPLMGLYPVMVFYFLSAILIGSGGIGIMDGRTKKKNKKEFKSSIIIACIGVIGMTLILTCFKEQYDFASEQMEKIPAPQSAIP